jgi:Protein of unknown function (DUF3574)
MLLRFRKSMLARHLLIAVASVSLALTACTDHRPQASPAAQATAPTLTGDPAHPGVTQGWVDTKLYFGLGLVDRPDQGISEAQWRDFLDHEVTPRFPAGLSVLDVYGQWQGKTQTTPERLRSKLLMIDYPDTQMNRDKIDAIRAAWKKLTGDRSVLRVTQPADVSF